VREIVEHAWQRFGIITSIIGDFQGRVIATLFYFTVLVPFGLGSRIMSDPMKIRSQGSQWLDRDEVANDLDSAKRQG
jgi:hypothetical protein